MHCYCRRGKLAAAALATWLAAGLAVTAAGAADTPTSTDAPDLAAVRATIKRGSYAEALAALNALVDKGVQHADVYNLMGFAHRKNGDLKQAATYYGKALDFDQNHKSALEYQGEMFLAMGEIARAQANLARLVAICPQGCEEREDLEKAIAAGAARKEK
jgi:tetratricopeptide (TPR) repeat protein